MTGLWITAIITWAMTGWMMANGLVMQQSLDAWSDPSDYTEALYVHAPDGACDVGLSDDGKVIKITLCEI